MVHSVTIKKGYYKDIDQLLKVCKNWIKQHSPSDIRNEFEIDYLEISRNAKIVIPNDTKHFKVIFPKMLQAILGFGPHPHTSTLGMSQFNSVPHKQVAGLGG